MLRIPLALLAIASLYPIAVAVDATQSQATSGWQPAGWGGGALYFAAAWHPTDPQVLYLGSDCAGVYRTADQAQHWTFANQGIRNYAVYSLAVSPAAPDLVYMLTDGGLCKSTDRAQTWSFIADSDEHKLDIQSARSKSIRAIAIDPVNAEIVYAGSRTGRLFKSVTGGASWRELPYRDSLPHPGAPPAFHGAGSLVLSVSPAASATDVSGRVSKFFGPGAQAKDWSAYARLSIHFRIPEQAPAVQVALVVQTGAAWRWQQGPWSTGTPGTWSEAALDLTAIQGLSAVDMVHVVVQSPQATWTGEVLIDALALEKTGSGAAPAAGPAELIADWEVPGNADGWVANHDGTDSHRITAVRQSQRAHEGDVLSSVAIAPSNPSLVFATNTEQGIFRSEDAGTTWSVVVPGITAMQAAVAAHDPSSVWAACGEAGLRHSTDGGRTWAAVYPDPTRKTAMIEVALAVKGEGRVYAIGNRGWGGCLYRSDDQGTTWTTSTSVRLGLPGDPTLPQDPGSLSMVTNIAINPQDPDQLLIAANWRNVFSADGGRTLVERSTGADNTCITDIQFSGGKTYATAMDEGLMVSENDGGEWRQLLPLRWDPEISGHFWRVRVAQVGAATRIVTTSSPWKSFGDASCANRAFVRADGGATFAVARDGLPGYVPAINCAWRRSFPRALAADPSHPEVLYLGMDGDPGPDANHQGGGVFRSGDGGVHWTRCAGQPGGRRMFYGLVVDPSEPKRVFWSSCGAGGGVWRSEDEGRSWAHVFQNDSWCFNCEISPSGMILAGGSQLYCSSDHGTTWRTISRFTEDPVIVGIAIDPADEKRIWISRTTWDGSSRGGIYRTTDGGGAWSDITGDIPYRKPLVLRYQEASHVLWAGGVGLFRLKQ